MKLQLKAESGQSKLARAVPRKALLVRPDEIVHSDPVLLRALEEEE